MQTKIKEFQVLHHLIVHKIKLQFSDQLFGYAWALLNPLVYIFSFWFFGYVGLRGGLVNGFHFVVWVIPGLLAYRFLATVLSQSATALTRNGMLISETGIKANIIPLVETLKESYIHIGIMLAMFIFYAFIGYTLTGTWDMLPSIYYLNFIYYWFVLFIYSIVLCYIISAIGLLFRDTKNIITSILVPLFWTTPVLFPVEHGIQPQLELIEMAINPFYYFIKGYRDTMLYGEFFYVDWKYNLYMWLIIFIMVLIARKLWKFITPIISDIV
ncbi:ABC transporter permease [Mollicutes bacterium LVI A0039]|nr:ABC transporter permease [Mollicutes bacterium LVI A0039]